MEQFDMVLLLLWLVIIFGSSVVVFIIIKYVIDINRVKKNSCRYKILQKNNEIFQSRFSPGISLTILRADVKSKAQYDKFDFEKFFVIKISENIIQWEKKISIIENNISLYNEYMDIIKRIPTNKTSEDAKRCKLSHKKFIYYEERILKEAQLIPAMDFESSIICQYVSPKGRNHYTKTRTYHIQDIKRLCARAKKGTEAKEKVAYERSLMTDKLRYDIMKRDKFRCQLCGRSADDGIKLHVDHIIPVSKGGKTIPHNLRTLCEQCNLGKSNKYDPMGPN